VLKALGSDLCRVCAAAKHGSKAKHGVDRSAQGKLAKAKVDARAIGIPFTKRDFEGLDTPGETLTREEQLAQFKAEVIAKKERVGMLIQTTKANAVEQKRREDEQEQRLHQQHDLFKDAHYQQKLSNYVRRKSIQMADQKRLTREAQRQRLVVVEGGLTLWQTIGDLVQHDKKRRWLAAQCTF
jgi:hypothetical protein